MAVYLNIGIYVITTRANSCLHVFVFLLFFASCYPSDADTVILPFLLFFRVVVVVVVVALQQYINVRLKFTK